MSEHVKMFGMTFKSMRNPEIWRVLKQPTFLPSFLLTPKVKKVIAKRQFFLKEGG